MAKKNMEWYDWLAIVLLVVGGINWGLYGVFSFNLVQFLLGQIPILAKIVYALVGIAGLYGFVFLVKQAS